jgi:hypothetical protein
MDEIFCPLCGKPNPVENTFCEYCLGFLDHDKAQSKDSVFSDSEENLNGLDAQDSEGESPEWLRSLHDSEREHKDTGANDDLGLELPAADTSDWLPGGSSFRSSTNDQDTPVSPFVGGDEDSDSDELPSWLNDALLEESPSGSTDDEIAPEIPKKQLDQDHPEKIPESPGDKEGAGPLAGLSGILSAQPGVARIRKPGAYSTNLRITESQEQHVKLLQSLLEQEGQPKPLPRKSPISQQHVLRWVIAIVLLLGVFWSLILSTEDLDLPIYDEGSAEVNRLINQLPESARVLVGFDYEPALADELDATAAPVFNHLMNEGALLTLISTSPNGPILAERFIQSGKLENDYINGLDYTNLGYIPGGAAGLISFIENPSGTTPFSIDGFAAWESETGDPLPPVVGIQNINDYDLILLLVDDPDLARIWIEQLSPIVTNPQSLVSLVLITSAQLEPVVRPYYESIPQPVNGLVVGLRGGAAYSRLIGGDQVPAQFWDAYGMGTFIAALVILIGGLGYFVAPELSRVARGQEKVD